MRLLFVCRLNRHRSATAERLFCKRENLDVRSAGTSQDAMARVNARMLDWADVIFAMDTYQMSALNVMFPKHPALKRIVCLEIPDRFAFNDPELVRLLEERVQGYLKSDFARSPAPRDASGPTPRDHPLGGGEPGGRRG